MGATLTVSLRSELEALLSEDAASAAARARETFDRIAAPSERSLVLFGAGNLGRKTLAGLRSLGIEPLAFSDNNPDLWGSSIAGVPVLTPSAAVARYGAQATFVVTIWRGEGTDTMAERRRPLLEAGCTRVVDFGALFWKYPETFLPHYSFDRPEKVLEQRAAVLRAFDLFGDDASRREYVAQIRWRLMLDFDGLPRPVAHAIYFPDDLVDVMDAERFVDCGAFDGDTMAQFLAQRGEAFERYVAIEADPANFQRLRRNVDVLSEAVRAKVELHQLAVSARRETVRFSATGTESAAVGVGSLLVAAAPLDEIVGDEQPTWIKMDIEGSEVDALRGARSVIRRDRPVLAVCVYHQQDHVWRIPALIDDLAPDYRFVLRPHLLESWDLVCYAIPASRLRPQTGVAQ